jgi:hypothetical protein
VAERVEEVEQARVIRWSHFRAVRLLMPALRWLHHSPNGGQRSAFTGAQMKALGVNKGFPDLILPVATESAPGLVIEMKSDTGRLSTDQNEWIAHYDAQGWTTHVCRSAEEARECVCHYFGILPDDAPALG